MVGTTAGSIELWMLSQDQNGYVCSKGTPIMTFKAHTMGTNTISVKVMNKECNDYMEQVKVIFCSGGDDQALTVGLICASLPRINESDNIKVEVQAISTKKEACASALKGIELVGDHRSGFRVYTTGYDQHLAMFAIFIDDVDNLLKINIDLLSTSPIDVKDINSLCKCICESEDGVKECIIAGGEGIEVFSFDQNIWHAASALRRCNKLLITCGSGFSADSGLATYETMAEDYKDMCNPLRLVDSLNTFQQFWLSFSKEYGNVSPHLGYFILENFCGGGKLKKLRNDIEKEGCMSPWWIYSSNVDG